MADKKNLCAQIDIALHNRVTEEKDRLEMTTSQYIAALLTEYYKMKDENGGTNMTGLQMAFAIVLIVLGILITVVILLQKNREADASAIQGQSSAQMNDNKFFDKTSGHAKDDTLANITKVLSVIFVIIAVGYTLFMQFHG